MASLRYILAIVLLALLSACDNAESARIDETHARLVGSWVRDDAPGAQPKVQRVLVLAADGKFTERIEATLPDGQVQHKEYAGEWSYDGIHLKRRFLREDGRQYSGGAIRFATFPLVSVDSREMVLDDTIQRVKASYRRAPGGAPA